MSIRTNTTTGSTGYQRNNTDTLARVVHELREVKRAIEALVSGGGTGLATEATLQQVESNTDSIEGLLTTIDADTSIVMNATRYAAWDMFPGNSKVITWVAGSVQPFVVDTIEYYSGASLMVTQTFTYDANDNVTSITAS